MAETPNPTPTELGTTIGETMARNVPAGNKPRTWSGLSTKDTESLTAAGIKPNSPQWKEAEAAAKKAFEAE